MFGRISNNIFLGVFFMLSFNIFHHFPHFGLVKDIWVVFIFVYLLVVLIGKHMLDGGKYFSFERYIFALCLMPIYSGVVAHLEFGQPLYYGVFSQRNIILIGASLILIYWVDKRGLTLEKIDKLLPSIGWFCLIFYSILVTTLNPSIYYGYVGFVGGGVVEPVHFILNSIFIIYTVLYYFLRGLKGGSLFNYVAMLIFLTYLIFIDGGRSKLLSLAIVIIIIFVKKTSFFRMVLFSPFIIIGTGVLIYIAYYFNSSYLDSFVVKFNDAISVVLTTEKSGDASANARIDEVNMVLPYIEKNWLFGNGFLSHQWQGGFLSKLGMFAPSDIGLIGNIFVFGAFGVLVFLWQFVYAWKFVRLTQKSNEIILIDASKYFLLFYFIHSLSTGKFIYHIYVSLIFISILFLSSKLDEKV